MAELQGDIEIRNIKAVIDQLKCVEAVINYGKLESIIVKLDGPDPDFPRIKKSLFEEVERVEGIFNEIKHSI